MCGWKTRISIQINPQRSWITKDMGLLGFQRLGSFLTGTSRRMDNS